VAGAMIEAQISMGDIPVIFRLFLVKITVEMGFSSQ